MSGLHYHRYPTITGQNLKKYAVLVKNFAKNINPTVLCIDRDMKLITLICVCLPMHSAVKEVKQQQ